MKRIDKKGVVKLILLIILLIMQIKAFDNSRANKITYITAKIIDSSGLLSDENSTLIAINEGNNGMAITLPNIINTKKISKYIITKKKIIETEDVEDESKTSTEEINTDAILNENENIQQTEEIIDEENTINVDEELFEEKTTNEEVIDDKVINEETNTETNTETIEMLPGEKIYLTKEELDTQEIELIVQYDTIEVESQNLYNKTLIVKNVDDYEVLSVSGYMPFDAVIDLNEIDILVFENEIIEKYPNSFLIGNYEVNLSSNGNKYIAKDYNQILNVEITIMDESKKHCVLEIQDDNTINELEQIQIENSKIKFTTDELKTYLVLEMQNESSIYAEENNTNDISKDGSNAKLEIDDYESDKNYYLGLNYTEKMSKKNSGKYIESNLKKIIVNYYSYNYNSTDNEVYGTISDTESESLISYIKCVPIDSNGNIELELIDNPFMNRPENKGFNGWKTNDTRYNNNISINKNTFVQILSTNINNVTDNNGEYVINLYPDWIDANVIFVSSSGSSTNSGTTPESPVNNNWTNINNIVNSNIKTCTNASNREVNIIVLMNGTLDISGLRGPNTPYTLTSLYNGINYGSSSTYLNVGNTDIYLDSDLQLDYIYIYSSKSYSSPSYNDTTDGTSAVTPCIYGNMYNLRIGRGIISTNNNYCAFAQVQGGYYNRSGSEYKLVVETGKYYTIQLYRAGSSSTSTTANAKLVIGCDIDRKRNNNENLKIQNRMASRTTSATCNPYNNGIAVDMNIKSGTIGVDYFNSESTNDNSDRNYAGIYVGGHGNTGYDKSDRYLLVEGGDIANIIGGLDMSESDMYKTYMYIKGGNIINITGGAGYTHTYGDRIIQVTGGCVKYSISGGSNGVAASSSSNNGQLTGASLIYVGGDAHIGASYTLDQNGNKIITETGSNNVLYGVNAGSVCGGANGNNNYAGQTDGAYIIIDGNAVVHNNVFGGGNYGIIGSADTVTGTPIIKFTNESSNFKTNTEYLITTSAVGGNGLIASNNNMANEIIAEAVVPSDSAKWIFESNGGTQYYIKNSATNQYIYISGTGGSWYNPTATVTLSATNKTAFNVSGTNTKTISYSSGTNTFYLKYNNGWTISGNSYWGGNSNNSIYLLTYEKLSEEEIEEIEALVNIKVYGGTVKNNIYGGANRNNINGTVGIGISGGNVDGVVYGGSNIKGEIVGAVSIKISGGKLGTNTNEDTLFGGGLGSETNVKGKVLLNINETNKNTEIYGNVYGGSSQGKVSSDIEIKIQDLPTSTNNLIIEGSVFGGGKGYGTTPADVSGNITINVDGSDLNKCNVFGGSNLAGTISGTIMINIGKTYKSTLYSVYGGGNQASIDTETKGIYVYLLNNANVINAFNGGKAADLISSGENDTTRSIYLNGGVAQNIYGGSDTSGTVTVSHVYIESGNATNVYGGNNQGGTTPITNIFIKGGNIGNVYGGGEKAETTISNIIVTGGTTNYIYGGGNQAGVTTTNIETKGGNIGTVFGGSNVSGDVENSFVTTNDANSGDSANGLTMDVKTIVNKATWENQNNPEYITNAKINITFTNNTSETITKWNATLFVPDSILRTNYSDSEILESDGVYTFTEKDRYWGTNEIPAGGKHSLEFEILTKQSVEEFTIGYEIKGQDSNGNSANYSKSIIGTVYGGNNHGGTTQTSNVTINGGGVNNVYGGGNQAVTNETNVNINAEVSKNVFGGGNQAGVNTNTNVILTGATVGDNVYGGGNQGTVTQNTYVYVKNSILKNSLYAGGNGVSATVFGNVNLTMHGTTNQVTNSVFGGGNQAATGTQTTNNSISTVNIVGGNIGKNIYGGANTSVVYGTTQTNIGYDAVNNTDLEIGDIYVGGTVFGGGEANASGSEIYDFDFISVTVGIDIQINGNGHDNFAILGSIFGSGNASSTSGTSYITIKNYGTLDKPQSNVSLQRADCATIINSALSLSGATDRTNEYSGTFFSISRITEIKLKNSSTLYLCNGANLLNKLYSLVDENGTETKGTVTINEEGGMATKNVDNRIYMLEGKNLNVALNEKATIYGQVQGMFFLGLFTNRNNPATSTGLYHNGYNNGDEIVNAGTFVSNSYVMAEHLTNPEHDIKVDGFYTNYNEEGIIKTDYIKPTPDEDVYYMWLCGEEMEVKVFPIEMVASKYATLGTYELALSGFADPNIKMGISGFSSGLIGNVSLVDPSIIETIEPNEELANSQFGLTMKTGNIGWQTKGNTTFLTKEGGTYIGTKNYNSDNTSYTPTLNFCFYHSQNLTKKQALGEVKIRFQVMTPVDDLNYNISYIDIDITLSTALFQDNYYEAAITPGQEFGLFTTTDTTITKTSTFSTYYSLLLQDFSNRDDFKEFANYKRVLVSRDINNTAYVFPINTKITMLDMATDKYYYYIVTEQDVKNRKYIYELADFIAMGSNDEKFNEEEMFDQYYNTAQNLFYENFIFHINFANSDLDTDITQNSLLMELRNNDNQTIIGVLGIQRENIIYTVFLNKEATIEVEAEIEPEKVYLGNPINLNVTTTFTQQIVGTKTIYDTQYFDQKLGIKISIYDINGNRLSNDSLLGINFELDNQYYYPRIDGTTRICIADKVTDILAKLKINTEHNNTLATGTYKIRIESFGSSDGIYYGLVASDMVEVDVTIINFAYGLKVITPDKAKIIDSKTGYTVNGNNSISTTVQYSSSLSNPNIALSLYRRDYTEEYSQNYTLVDLKEYVTNLLTSTTREKEYVVSTNPLEMVTYYLSLKDNLMTGTYKLVYKLYDGNTYIGEVYEYMIIK